MSKKETEKAGRKLSIPGLILSAVMLVLTVIFLILAFHTQMIPTSYMVILCVIGFAVWLAAFLLMKKPGRKVRFIIGIIWMIIWLFLYTAAGYYLYQTRSALSDITDTVTESSVIAFYVKENDPAKTLADAKDYNFGILKDLDRENTDKALDRVSEEDDITLSTTEYDNLLQLSDALLEGEVNGIILNQAYLDLYQEIPSYEDFPDQIRLLASKNLQHTVNEAAETQSDTAADHVLNIYISGSDTRESTLPSRSRSDVNIIASLNTKTHEIVLISTPRDYYVPLSISGGIPDKLTHAGIYGIDVSMDTLSELYGIDLDYYFKVNFNGFIDIIDALGGITVESDYDFSAGGYQFSEGTNKLNGTQALAFCRERYAFAEGDRQRGENQMAVISGVLQKALSPSILQNYTDVLNSAENCMETDIPYDVLAGIVRQQLSDNASWHITSYSTNGTGAKKVPYSMSTTAYVMIPDEETVEHAKLLLEQNMD